MATTPAAAGSPCELRFEGTSVSEAWSDVLRDVTVLVGRLTPETTDCRTIAVLPDGGGATVVFTTVDGRTARRRIAAPRELHALVEALLVFGHDPAPSADDRDARSPADAPEPPPSRPTASTAPASIAALSTLDVKDSGLAKKSSSGLLLGAAAGVKQSWPRDTVAAVGQGFVGLSLPRWELAAFGRWEMEHDAANDAGTRLRFSAIGGGAMFGRRETVGPLVLFAGTRAALFDAEEETKHDDRREAKHRSEFLDPRLGLYAGCIFAESSRVRFRVQVDGDAGLLVHRSDVAELPAFPRWNLGVSLGAEAGFIP